MNKLVKYGLLVLALVALLVASWLGYRALSARYQPQEPDVQSVETQTGQTQTTQAAQTATDFSVTDAQGNEVKLSDYFGKPIVINFWASWCGPCKSELPAFDALYAQKGDDVTFLMVNLMSGYGDTPDTVKAFAAENGYSFPLYFDSAYSAATAYGISSIPMTVFIDRNGSVFDTRIGAMNEQTLTASIEALLDAE